MFSLSLLKEIESFVEVIGEWQDRDSQTLSLCSDSRKYQKGELFWAIKGPNFNGFKFSSQVIEHGCSIIVFEEDDASVKSATELSQAHPHVCFVSVKDSLKALQQLSKLRLEQWRNQAASCFQGHKRVLGITGSNGKTTHKELLWGMLNQTFPEKVYCTPGNLNNHIGVPLTLLGIKDYHEIVIVEMGTNHHGEIPFLSELVEPDSGLITNIGASHLEFLINEEGVFKEKRALFDQVAKRSKGIFIVNKDDEFLSKLNKSEYEELRNFSQKDESADVFYKFKGTKLSFTYQEKEFEIDNKNLFGEYNYRNLLACFLLAAGNFPKAQAQIAQAANQVKLPENNRSTFLEKNGKKIFLDAYNANPSSMKESILAYSKKMEDENQADEETLFIVGDMNELGDLTEKAHQELGELLTKLNHQHILYVGNYQKYFKQGFQNCLAFTNVEEVQASNPDIIKKAKFIFIKASRSLQLETLLDIV